MNEKRFSWKTEKLQHSDDEVIMVVDNTNKEWKGHILNIVDLLNNLAEENEQLQKVNSILNMNEDDLKECTLENIQLKEENKQLLYKLQQTKEYLQAKIDECKNHKKMKEIVFGVEQKVGYEKALLQLQEGLKRRWNDE